MLIERILIPLDGSELAERAIPHAEQFARIYGAKIVLLRVLEAIAKNAMQTLSTMLNYGRMRKTEAYEEIDSLCGGTVPQASVSRDGKPGQTTINWVLTHLMKEQSGTL